MFHGEYFEYLKRQNKSNYEDFKNYYIPRKLKRFILIDRKILENTNESNQKKLIIVHSKEEFEEKCSQKASLRMFIIYKF